MDLELLKQAFRESIPTFKKVGQIAAGGALGLIAFIMIIAIFQWFAIPIVVVLGIAGIIVYDKYETLQNAKKAAEREARRQAERERIRNSNTW